MWKFGQTIGDREGRMDACITAAGTLNPDTECLEYDSKASQRVYSLLIAQDGHNADIICR